MNQKLDKFYRYLELYEKLVMANACCFVDECLAEDVSQETFEKMYEHLDYIDDDGVKGWLMVVSSNIAKDYIRKGKIVDICYMNPLELSKTRKGVYKSAEESFEEQERKKAALDFLWAACELLYQKNPQWYYVMVDSCMLEMSSEEIGKVLNLTTGNVDVIKSRARRYLKEELKDRYREFF